VRRLAVVVVLAMVGLVGIGITGARADAVSDEAAFVVKINALRASKGLGSLTVDPELTSIARDWAQKMANDGDISHNPILKDLVTLNWSKLGENVGMGPALDSLFQAFVDSPHHYENLVDPSFTYIGVGVVWKGGTMFTAHEFMTLRDGTSTTHTSPPATTATTRRPTTTRPPVVTTPTAPKPVTTTTIAPPPPPPPPPPPTVPDRVRLVMEMLRPFDPAFRLP
jgi:hypothetical protein